MRHFLLPFPFCLSNPACCRQGIGAVEKPKLARRCQDSPQNPGSVYANSWGYPPGLGRAGRGLWEARGRWSGRGQDSTCNSYPGPLFKPEWRFPRQQHQAPSHSDPETLLPEGAKGCSYPAFRAGLLPFPTGLGTFSTLHMLPDLWVLGRGDPDPPLQAPAGGEQ